MAEDLKYLARGRIRAPFAHAYAFATAGESGLAAWGGQCMTDSNGESGAARPATYSRRTRPSVVVFLTAIVALVVGGVAGSPNRETQRR